MTSGCKKSIVEKYNTLETLADYEDVSDNFEMQTQ